MLFSLNHGQHAVQTAEIAEHATSDAAAAVSVDAVVPDMADAGAGPMSAAMSATMPDAVARRAPSRGGRRTIARRVQPVAAGKFRYYFPDAPSLVEDDKMPGWLDALADSMVEAGGPPPGNAPDPASSNSLIPPVFTYLGQFIDHDITANTDRDSAISIIDGQIEPLARAEVADGLVNLRDGSLGLDSLYGDATGQHAFAAKLAGLMRSPAHPAKMRLAKPIEPDGGRVPLPVSPDDATDLLRLGFLLDRGLVTLAELQALEPELRKVFLETDGSPILARAIIGDARNDENLIVAQLHTLFLRLHNKFADATGGRSFRRARRLTMWHYQWLVVNSYLRTICDPAVLDQIIDLGAPRYTAFVDAHGTNGEKMPMPLEFSVAAFRFGHSMVRAAYDHNRFFGEPVAGSPSFIAPVTPFSFLFAFTGNGRMFNDKTRGQLPSNWVIEWERWIATDPAHPARAARKLDTNLAPPLADMANESPDVGSMFRHLARRNLRRGYRLSLPNAQGCIAAIGRAGYSEFATLTPRQLRSGSPERRKAVKDGHFDKATPLWFYVLKEAEVLGNGEHLGPLGSHIVAETLIGLIVNDPDSYWNADGGRWSPDKFRAADPIDSIEDMVRFCGML